MIFIGSAFFDKNVGPFTSTYSDFAGSVDNECDLAKVFFYGKLKFDSSKSRIKNLHGVSE